MLTATAIGGAPFVTVGIFIFAWTAFPHVHWIVPIVGTAFFGAGCVILCLFYNTYIYTKLMPSCSVVLVYSGIFTFLVDAYPEFAASALAANSFARSSFAGIFPLFGTQSTYNQVDPGIRELTFDNHSVQRARHSLGVVLVGILNAFDASISVRNQPPLIILYKFFELTEL